MEDGVDDYLGPCSRSATTEDRHVEQRIVGYHGDVGMGRQLGEELGDILAVQDEGRVAAIGDAHADQFEAGVEDVAYGGLVELADAIVLRPECLDIDEHPAQIGGHRPALICAIRQTLTPYSSASICCATMRGLRRVLVIASRSVAGDIVHDVASVERLLGVV